MKGYKWENRAISPDMKPIDINTVNTDAAINLSVKVAKGFIKDYKSAVIYGNDKRRGATLEQCRRDLDHPFYQALMECIKTNKEAIKKEAGDFGENN